MNRIIQYGSAEGIPYHNCSRKSFDQWELTGVKRPLLGLPIMVFGVFVELLYIPIIYIIFKTKLINLPCYKVIMLLAMIDMNATICSCLLAGYLFTIGAVYCMYPIFVYVTGLYTLSTWAMACAATVCLFINRVVSIAFRKYAYMIETKLAYSSIILVIIYGLYMFFFVPSIIFNSAVMAYLAEPLSEEVISEEAAAMYKNIPHEVNNWGFTGCMFILFSLYFILVKKLENGQKSKASRAIFIQCFIICFFNTAVAVINVTLAFMTPPPSVLVFCQLCWSFNHACPAFIYITMNETIRGEFLKLIFRMNVVQKVDDPNSASAVRVMTTRGRSMSTVG